MTKSFYCIVLIFLFFFTSFSQEIEISGFVNDTLEKPIENATLLFVPENKSLRIKYAITDVNGFYNSRLAMNTTYNIEVSSLGYEKINQKTGALKSDIEHNFYLKREKQFLNEVLLNYKYKAIEKKKDTTTYNLKSFVNGNENKMEDVITKLPGVKIENNSIKVKGQTIDKLLVDGKTFFGGGTKLALENLPANVMKKIQIISNYTESELLKNIENEKNVVLNVVLKDDKKNIFFGGLEMGYGVENRYLIHPTLFKYSKKSTLSFLGDLNNFNHKVLSFGDLLRLSGGYGSLIKNVDSNLIDFISNTDDKFKANTKFSALNFHHKFKENFHVEGYGLLIDNDYINKSESAIKYIDGQSGVNEERDNFSETNRFSVNANLKAIFNSLDKGTYLVYNANLFTNDLFLDKENNSLTGEISNNFSTIKNDIYGKFSHYIEGIKKKSKHTYAFSARQSISNLRVNNTWGSNDVFLQNILPLQEANLYLVANEKKINAKKINILFKDYWLATNNTHIFSNMGYNREVTTVKTEENQILNDQSIVNFSRIDENFGNHLNYQLSDVFITLGLKSKFLNFIVKAEIIPHYFTLAIEQSRLIKQTKLFLEPRIEVDYSLGKNGETISFFYNYSNKYPEATRFLEKRTITNFNSVVLGNPSLVDERHHIFSLDYNFDKREDFYFNTSIDYTVSSPSLKNEIIQEGINQINTSSLIFINDTSLNFYVEGLKKFKFFNLDFELSLDWSRINQIVNGNISPIETQDYMFKNNFKKKINKYSHINLSHSYNINSVVDTGDSNLTENVFALNFDTKLFKNFRFDVDLSRHFINDFQDKKSTYTIANSTLRYKSKRQSLTYGLLMYNIFNNDKIVNSFLSETVFRTERKYSLSRTLMFQLELKF